MLDFTILDKDELIRACQLVGIKNKEDKKLGIWPLERLSPDEMIFLIKKQIHNNDILENISAALKKTTQNYDITEKDIFGTLKLFKIKHTSEESIDDVKQKLYEYNAEIIAKAIKKMSKKKRKALLDELKEQVTPEKAEIMQKMARKYGSKAIITGESILAIQGVAIAATGFNLGLSIFFVQSLSTVSTIIGVTFPFAVYQSAAVAGGWILGWAGVLTNPALLAILISLNLYLLFSDISKKKYVNIAGLNYLIESKKKMIELLNEDI